MKMIILIALFFYSVLVFGQAGQEDTIVRQRCELLRVLFSENIFYKLPSLNLKFSDTITVFDKSNFFYGCDSLRINNKKVIIKYSDLLPHPLIGAWGVLPEYREKYKCYFIIENLQIKGKIIIIDVFKVLSNHRGFFAYKIVKNKFELIDYELKQH